MKVHFKTRKHLLRKYCYSGSLCQLVFFKYLTLLFLSFSSSGSFGEDIGEDYFGFKELGLDREYNIDALSVRFGKKTEIYK